MHHDVAMRHAPILSVNVTGTRRSVLSVKWNVRYGAHTHPCGDREWPVSSVTPVLAGPSPRGFRRTRLCGSGTF